MLNIRLAQKYARAIFEVAAEEGQLREFGAQLAEVNKVITSQPDLQAFISNPQVQTEAKKEVIDKLFKEDLTGFVYNFIMLLIDKRRETLLKEIVAAYQKMANQAQNIVEAKVTVASALTKAQEARLIQKLQETTGKTVVVDTTVDKGILGGVIVRIGDKLIDGSVMRQMQALKAQLMAN